MNIGIECPVCGRDKFEDFSDLDSCSVCGWKINVVQYDDHDYSNGNNALSVNECKLEWSLLNNEKTKDTAQKLKSEFTEAMHGLRREFREKGRIKSGMTCDEIRQREIKEREGYVERLEELNKA
ncbi:MAG: hypothetical protein GX025_06690 [Clostridiales bacterium]|nr:hypothetical protein [Clostridiales bacterium]